jgi:hypothetical protein
MAEMPQPVAVAGPVLIMVAKTVAGTPTCTERLLGKTAATNEVPDELPGIVVVILKGTGPVERKLIQPIFSPQAIPSNSPVVGEIEIPKLTILQLFVLIHEKEIHPIFSPHAQPERLPTPSLSTP